MNTDWDSLAFPRLCGLAAEKPTKLSQAMHNAGIASSTLPFTYVAFDTSNTETTLQSMRELGMRGLSLSIPHKERALSLVDHVSDEGKKIGAINTVVNTGTKLYGYNTDCYGIEQALLDAGVSLAGSDVLILGAGGAARAAAHVATGAKPASVVIANRNEDRAAGLIRDFTGIQLVSWKKAGDMIEKSERLVLLQATPIGTHLAPDTASFPFDLRLLHSGVNVLDMVTKPSTALLDACKAHGGTAISGLKMLLFQAVRQFEIFTEQSAPIAAMEEALRREVDAS